MTLTFNLHHQGITGLIKRLEKIKLNIEESLDEAVDVICREGATAAKIGYGGSVAVESEASNGMGKITATADHLIIREFGAGDATLPVLFQNYPGVDVYPGSYSEQEGSGEYAMTGRWHFGGHVYTEVPAQHGLLDAKFYIQGEATEIAREVIRYD